MEAFLTGMMHERRKSVGKAKAIRQHHIVATSYAELLLIEAVSVEHAVEDAFGRRHHHIGSIHRHSTNVPLPVLNILLHLLELCRIVFLHPHILDGAFVVESEGWVLCHQSHVVDQSVLNILRDCGLYIPVPLRIKMGVGNEEESLVVLCLAQTCPRAEYESGEDVA